MTWDEIFSEIREINRQSIRETLDRPKFQAVFRKQSEILVRLDEIERLIRMNHDETIAALNRSNATLDSVSADIDALLVIVGQLQNADTAPDVAALIDQLDTKLQATDAKFTPPPAP